MSCCPATVTNWALPHMACAVNIELQHTGMACMHMHTCTLGMRTAVQGLMVQYRSAQVKASHISDGKQQLAA